jgi:hypothetical protein
VPEILTLANADLKHALEGQPLQSGRDREGQRPRALAYVQHVSPEFPKARSFDDVDALLPDRVQLRNDPVR